MSYKNSRKLHKDTLRSSSLQTRAGNRSRESPPSEGWFQEGESLWLGSGYLPVALCEALIVIAMPDILVLEVIEHREHIAALDDVQALVNILNAFYVHCCCGWVL